MDCAIRTLESGLISILIELVRLDCVLGLALREGVTGLKLTDHRSGVLGIAVNSVALTADFRMLLDSTKF